MGGAAAGAAGLVLHIGESRYPLADATREGTTWTWTGNAPGWAGGDAACLALTAPPDTTPPTLLRAEVRDGGNGQELILTFDEVLDQTTTSIPGASAFTVTVEGEARAVAQVENYAGTGQLTGVLLKFSESDAIRHGERVTVAYTKPTGDGAKPLKDRAGNEVESFTDVAVANGLEAPEVVAPDPSSFPVAVANFGKSSELNGAGVTKTQPFTQQFKTGTNAGGYFLRAVQLDVRSRSSGPSSSITVALHANSSGPGAKIATLTRTSDLNAGIRTFNAPAGGVFLEEGTKYHVVIRSSDANLILHETTSGGEDSEKLDGWSINDKAHIWIASGNRWSTNTDGPIKLRVRAETRTAGAEGALVSNLGRGRPSTYRSDLWFAQAFTTGPNPAGYDLTGVRMAINVISGGRGGLSVTVKDGRDGDTVAALTVPGTIAATTTFAAPAGTVLEPDTTYWVTGGGGNVATRFAQAIDNAEESGRAAGWSIADSSSRRTTPSGSWSSNTNKFVFAIQGRVRTNLDDANLKALAVAGQRLNPDFAAGTTSYRLREHLPHATDRLTLSAATREDGAVFEFQDAAGNTLADAAGTDGFQADIGVGTTTLKAKATALDRTTTRTYSIDVVRWAACSAASAEQRIWKGNMEVGGRGNATAYRGFASGSSGYGFLDDKTFAHAGTDYTIGVLATVTSGQSRRLVLQLSALPADDSGLVLHIGDRQYRLDSATRNAAANTYTWTANLPDWGKGDAACLALTGADRDGPEVAVAQIAAGSSGRTLSLTFGEDLDTAAIPGPGAFTVTVTAEGEPEARTPAAALVHGQADTLTLALATAVRPGERVTVTYAPPEQNPLRDRAGKPRRSAMR